ncbi:uncharacterized protein LOC118599671, partial [Oryzias melastigma]|uniref:uncharacterized protein LOC118599671 n=1 Tax=Oryzias melastigma TaxID=30732 RepID=UPI00168CB2E6
MESEEQDMSRRIQDLENELATLRAAATNPGTSSSSGASSGSIETVRQPPVIYVQQDRKLPFFSGKLNNTDSLTLDEWIAQMTTAVQTRGRSEVERAQIVFDHLEGAARTEIKFLPRDQRECVESIFDALKDVYGGTHSRVALQRKFFNRKQQESESLIDYSHSLMELMEQIIKSDGHAAATAAKDLRDQFCDGVRDSALRMRLKDLVH